MNAYRDETCAVFCAVQKVLWISRNSVTGNPETRITVDNNKGCSSGLTVAQICCELAAELKAENTATTLTGNAGRLPDTPVVVVKPAGDRYAAHAGQHHGSRVHGDETRSGERGDRPSV